ncbi:hypothetical protein FOG50_03073 [Hanseniaspora uvarum]|nr:hypothetical protein FOG50_03073 [Hanseniaspora uvarum]
MPNFFHIENNVVNNFILTKTKHLNLPNEILFFAVVLFSSYFFNLIYLLLFKFVKIGSNKNNSRSVLKQLYVLFVGLFYVIGVLNSLGGFYLMFVSSLAVYLVSKYNYKNSNKIKNLPWYVLIVLIAFVLFCHIQVDLIENGEILTGSLMVLVIKLHEFSWNCHDYANSESDKLSPFQKDKIVTEFPGLLEFYSYIFFYGTLLTGPAFEYKIYIKWVKSDNQKQPIKNPALWKFGKGIFFLVAFLKLSEMFPVGDLIAKNDFSLFKKFFLLYFIGMIFRFKYYGAWSIAESLCNMIQLGYNSTDNNYYLIKNVNVRGFEFAQNVKGALENWNESTNLWLKNYIYIRFVQVNNNATLASLITFTVSASWHGTHAGYYLTFVTGSSYQTAGKIIRRFIRPHFIVADSQTFKLIYDFITLIITQTAFGYLVMPFIVLNIKDSITIWKSVYFIPHISIIILQLIKPFLKKKAIKTAPKLKVEIKDDDLKNILKDKFAYENKQKKD